MFPVSFKVEYFPDDLHDTATTTILIRTTGIDGLVKAKAQAMSLSRETCSLAFMIGSDAEGRDIGQIVYSEGREGRRTGCFAKK